MNWPTDKKLLYLITSGEIDGGSSVEKEPALLDLVRVAVELEVPLIQLREKALSVRDLYCLAAKVVEITRNTPSCLLINDRADLAAAVGADGVHLTSRSLRANVIRLNFPGLLIGVSAHSALEVKAAHEAGADLAVFGPVFSTPEKGAPVGVDELRRVCAAVPAFPVIGLGGIDEGNFEEVLATGAAGFAAIRWLNDQGNLRYPARKLGYGK